MTSVRKRVIDATTQGDGDISIDAGGNITGSAVYGIRSRSYGTGDQTVTTKAGSEAAEILHKRATEGLDEFRAMASQHAKH